MFTPTPGPVDLRHLDQWWTWTPGAFWRRPEGRGSSLADRADHPVVHVAHEDAETYAAWAGLALPTEVEWEAAARGGLDHATSTWGDDPEAQGERLATGRSCAPTATAGATDPRPGAHSRSTPG